MKYCIECKKHNKFILPMIPLCPNCSGDYQYVKGIEFRGFRFHLGIKRSNDYYTPIIIKNFSINGIIQFPQNLYESMYYSKSSKYATFLGCRLISSLIKNIEDLEIKIQNQFLGIS